MSYGEHRKRFSLAQQYKPCATGTWNAKVIMDKVYVKRVGTLMVWHAEQNQPPEDAEWREDGSIGVDAGMASIVDAEAYPENPFGQDGNTVEFNEMCRASDDHTHIWRNRGVITYSGFGDGRYNVYVARGESGLDTITGVKIVFIDDQTRQQWAQFFSRSRVRKRRKTKKKKKPVH